MWSIATRPLKAAHFAAFPIDLPARCIAAGCRPGGVVLEPFSGAGTTGLAAARLGRRYIGIDLNAAFHDLAVDRLRREVSAGAGTAAGTTGRVDGGTEVVGRAGLPFSALGRIAQAPA